MTIEQITDHEERALRRLAYYTRNADFLRDFLRVMTNQAQSVEDVAWAMLTERLFEDVAAGYGGAVGAQIDILGKHVGEERLDKTDEQYLAAIAVRILVNTSNGSAPTLMQIVKLHSAPTKAVYVSAFPAAYIIFTTGGSDYLRLFDLLSDATLGGVGTFIVSALTSPAFATSEHLYDATNGATSNTKTFTVTHSLSDVLVGDALRIYPPDTDAGLYSIAKVNASSVEVTPETLTAPRSGISYEITRLYDDTGGLAELKSSGENGATAAPDIFNSAGSTFQSDGVDTTHKVYAVDYGLFDIDSVPAETQIKSASLVAALGTSATGVNFYIVDAATAGFLGTLIS